MTTYVGTLRSPVWLAPKPARPAGPGLLPAIEGATLQNGWAGTFRLPQIDESCDHLTISDDQLAACTAHCAGEGGVRSCQWKRHGVDCRVWATCNDPVRHK